MQGHTAIYTLPAATDPEGDTITFTSNFPAFVSVSAYSFIMNPTTLDIGTYTITASLSDGKNPI